MFECVERFCLNSRSNLTSGLPIIFLHSDILFTVYIVDGAFRRRISAGAGDFREGEDIDGVELLVIFKGQSMYLDMITRKSFMKLKSTVIFYVETALLLYNSTKLSLISNEAAHEHFLAVEGHFVPHLG